MARVLVVDDAAFMRKMVSDALREIIELDPSARVVMCSALGQESKVLESIKLGANDFVVKPFQADRVLEAVGKALG
jgi:two-component system chemotaxis response regulator CheY